MCKYGIKTENARFGMRAAIAKRFRGDAAPERLRFFRISVGFGCEACACLGARALQRAGDGAASAAPSAKPPTCIKDKHTSRSHTRIFTVYLPYIYRIFGADLILNCSYRLTHEKGEKPNGLLPYAFRLS